MFAISYFSEKLLFPPSLLLAGRDTKTDTINFIIALLCLHNIQTLLPTKKQNTQVLIS
jgi:hypothetical protein